MMKYNEVYQKICNSLGVNIEDAMSNTRRRQACEARQMFTLWLRTNTTLPLTEIAKQVRLMPQDHTTVLHSIRTIQNLIYTDSHLRDVWGQSQFLTVTPFTSLRYSPLNTRF